MDIEPTPRTIDIGGNMIIKLPIKPLSVNRAFQGRRFKTKEHNSFCKSVSMLLMPYKKGQYSGMLHIEYRFYLKNFIRIDIDNLIKPLQDCLVANGIIKDDRFIVGMLASKYPAEQDRIEIFISEVK